MNDLDSLFCVLSSALTCVLTFAVLKLFVGTSSKEEGDTLGLDVLSRIVKGCPSETALGVEIGIVFNEKFDDFMVTMEAGLHQRSCSKLGREFLISVRAAS